MWFALFAVFSLYSICQIKSQGLSDNAALLKNETDCFPSFIQLYEDEIINIKPNCSQFNSSLAIYDTFQVKIEDESIAILLKSTFTGIGNLSHADNESILAIKGLFLGRTELILEYKQHWEYARITKIKISVIRQERIINHVFVGIVTLLMMLAYVGMGCDLDLAEVKDVLKRPIAPIIGFFCQYIIMPLSAFAVVKCLGLSGGVALGFFASGCAPGGGASNMYTRILDGDLSLSVTMTLISTIASLGMYPLWLHTLGRLVYDTHGSPLRVPFTNIFISLAVMIIPLAIGAFIKVKRPNWAESIRKIMKPFFIIIIILLIVLGTCSHIYLLKLLSPWLVLGACILSYSGFLLGGILAFIFRFRWSRVLAVAVETGVQNTGLPILLLKYSLPQPDADLSIISPVTVAMLMPVPLWIAVAIMRIRKKCKGSPVQTKTSESEVKVLKSSEINGGPVNFVEFCDGKVKNSDMIGLDYSKHERENFKVCDEKVIQSLHIPTESGDSQHQNDRF